MPQPKTASKSSSHTPGPWAVYNEQSVLAVIKVGTAKEVIHWAGFDSSDFPRELEANARLIAQSPDMYELLEKILMRLHGALDPIVSEARRIKAEIDRE